MRTFIGDLVANKTGANWPKEFFPDEVLEDDPNYRPKEEEVEEGLSIVSANALKIKENIHLAMHRTNLGLAALATGEELKSVHSPTVQDIRDLRNINNPYDPSTFQSMRE